MRDPFKSLTVGMSALEEFQQRQRLIDDVMKPSVIERAFKDAERGREIMAGFERLGAADSALKAAMGRGLETSLTAKAAMGLNASRFMTEQTRLLEFTRTPAYQSAIEQAAKGFEFYEKHQHLIARFENPRELSRLSGIAATYVQAWHVLPERPWQSVLEDRMARLNIDWALAGAVEASAEAFGRLGRLADVARYATPYIDETAEVVGGDLGAPTESPDRPETVEEREGRYDEAGRDRELIAFPPSGYPSILVTAGFAVSFPAPPPLQVVSGLIEAVQYSPETGHLLQSLEAHLRQFVVRQLEGAAGRAWLKQRVPHEMREAWKAMALEAEAEGKPVFPPIQYANFMDLFDVISRKDNWEIFAPHFRNRDNLRVAMLRLYSIRNDIAHARPISMTDLLVATTESTLLFRSIGFGVSYDA